MAITTNSLVEYFGDQDTLGGTATALIADAGFSIINATTGMNSWINDDNAPMASISLLVDYITTAPDANSGVNLYCRPLNIEGTNDQEVPDANFTHTYLGRFPVNDVLTPQYITIDVSLPNNYTSQEFEFYIQNNTGQTILAGWDFYITPKTYGPHA